MTYTTAETANIAAITLNNATATKIADANVNRRFLSIALDPRGGSTARTVWLKLGPASDNNDKKGIPLVRIDTGAGPWTMPTDAVYIGEVSAILEDGINALIYVTEY